MCVYYTVRGTHDVTGNIMLHSTAFVLKISAFCVAAAHTVCFMQTDRCLIFPLALRMKSLIVMGVLPDACYSCTICVYIFV